MMLDTCAIVVTYNPTQNDIEQIYKLSQLIHYLIVYDNSEPSIASQLSFIHNGEVIFKNQNVGIATALNEGVKKAILAGYKKVFLFDQDSFIDEHFLQAMMNFSNNYPDAALWAPSYYDINKNAYGCFLNFNVWTRQKVSCANKEIMNVDMAITSGALINTDTWKTVGGFMDTYFIDHVDHEYCLRLKKSGYEIKANGNIVLKHCVGNATAHSFMGLTLSTSNHAALRRYYISRNYVDMIKRFKLPSLLATYILYLAKATLFITCFETNKYEKLSKTVQGLWDGIRGRMGKY